MLTRSFLKNLATKAHRLRPVVLIGSKGLTPQVHQEVEAALTAHQLIKIKLNVANRALKQTLVEELIDQHPSTIVQRIGHILVLYRAQEES